ncbi:MAG: hypothetical protein K2M06_00965 [Muribaculaceae bacterium]|nr:hypothetical protein [Muribaculaceae bacterium]
MTKIGRFFAALAISALLGAAAVSCSKNSEPENPVGDVFSDIVTLATTGEEGTTFVYRMLNDSPEITLTTTQRFQDATVKPGARLMLNYIAKNGTQHESGAINVLSYVKCFGPTITTASTSSPTAWASSKVFLSSAWRSGKWLNLSMALEMGTTARRFELVLDPATADSAEPELHIVFTPDVVNAGMSLPAYASYDISALWDRQETEGLKIFFVSPDGNEQSAHISKGASSLKPME